MLQIFRNFFKSKVGIVVTLAFLGLIALAFASMDVSNTGTFGGVTGGDRVAVVGDRRIDAAELDMNARNAFNRVRQENPTLTMEAFIAGGGVEETLQQMIGRAAITEFGREYGLRAGDRLVDSEILQIPQFRGADGSFDSQTFRDALRQQGLTEAVVREDLAMSLMARQMLTPVTLYPRMPQSIALRYAQLLGETRNGAIAPVPAAAFAPEGDPTAEQLQAFYNENREDYIRPERRVLRYATFGEEALGGLPEPTNSQIRARYEENREQFADRETRTFTQLVLPTEAAAQAVIDEVEAGTSLQASAREKGLATTDVGPLDREDLAGQTSTAVAQAAFAAVEGNLAQPARGSLGWYVMRVDSVSQRAGRSLAQARNEIAQQIADEQRREALNEMTSRIENEFADGRSLSEVAEELGIELQETRPLTASGQVYGTQEQSPEELSRVLSFAFEMEQREPQLAETVPGETFLIFDVSDVTRSAAAPLDEIREEVVSTWRYHRGMQGAGETASRIMQRVSEGQSLAEAVQAEDVPLPAPQQVELNRQQASQMGQLPPALALFFSMAEGTVKRLENPQAQGWVVVELEDITAPELEADAEIVQATAEQLQMVAGDEYMEQLIVAIEDSVEAEVNDTAVEAVIAQLTGQNQ